MSDVPMNERNIVFFPMQSVQIGVDEADNPIYDNAADAEILQNLRQMEIKDGVYPDDSTYLQVMSNDDMTVSVKAGYAHVRGVQVWVREDVTLALTAADELLDRVDRVVLRLSLQNRNVTLTVKTGDTALTRVEGQTWELGLADIAVDHLNDTITQAEITDLRLDTTACGVVSGLMQVDTQSIFNQYMTWWADQQDTSGYLTAAGEYPQLATESKNPIGAINEVNGKRLSEIGMETIAGLSGSNPQEIIENFVSKALPFYGSWTPTVNFDVNNSVSYATRMGSYLKIGRLVTCRIFIDISSLGGNSGLAYLDDLPFPISGTLDTAFDIPYYYGFLNKTGAGLFTRGGTGDPSRLYFAEHNWNGFTNLTASNFQAGTKLGGTFSYISAT